MLIQKTRTEVPDEPDSEMDISTDAGIKKMLARTRDQRFDPQSDASQIFDKWPCLKEMTYVSGTYLVISSELTI